MPDAVSWRDEIKAAASKKTRGRSIHFSDFSHKQKKAACGIIAAKPIRFTAAIAHKPSLNRGTFKDRNQLYFYLTRYIIERVSWLCRDAPDLKHNGLTKILFSRRGGMSYDNFSEYLKRLRHDQSVQVHWPSIDIGSVGAEDHSADAGLQLADCGAGAINEAFEHDIYGNVESEYIRRLKKVIYNRNDNYLSYGVKIIPNHDSLPLSQQQKDTVDIFRK
jgi:hypothetical protein